MTTVSTWILGAGGQARETFQLLVDIERAAGRADHEFAGFIDEVDEGRLAGRSGALVLGLGTPATRALLVSRFGDGLFEFPALVHPHADIGDDSMLAAGVVVSAGCVVTTNVRLGEGSLLNPRAGVGHDSTVGRCCVVNPGANISGSVVLGDEVLVGSGAVVLQGITVGPRSVVGAGAVVTKDVPPDTTVAGVPARAMPATGGSTTGKARS